MPGKAWSSPGIADNVVWLTTASEVTPTDQEREQLLAEVKKSNRNEIVRSNLANDRRCGHRYSWLISQQDFDLVLQDGTRLTLSNQT